MSRLSCQNLQGLGKKDEIKSILQADLFSQQGHYLATLPQVKYIKSTPWKIRLLFELKRHFHLEEKASLELLGEHNLSAAEESRLNLACS